MNTRTSEGPAEREAASVARNAAARAVAAPPAADWVTIDGLEVSYGDTTVLEGVSFGIPRGSLVAVLGPSGCGKTTLLRAVAGLLPASAGTIRVGTRVVSSASVQLAPEKRGMGWVPQDASLFPHLSVGENIGFGLPRGGRTGGKAARAARIVDLAELVGLTGLVDRSPAQLSGGQAQRVSLARALAARPDLMLLDEPFAALDPLLRAALRIEVAALLRDQNSTSLLVTHDQEEALSLADYVAVMRGGRLLQWGTPAEVYEHPVSRWVAGFVGDTVELDGRWVGAGTAVAAAATGRVECALGVVPARAFDGAAPVDGAAVRLMLRPEWLHLSPAITRVIAPGPVQQPARPVSTAEGAATPIAPASAAAASVTLVQSRPRARQLPGLGLAPAGTEPVVALVTDIAYAGHDALVSVEVADGTVIRARVAAPDLPQRGDRVRVSIRRPALAYPLD
ncbi:ATP-binding cassette domain-containing protein [Cryobacterium melibiosiphilum]|uniref:ABC-type quaternary amine transporter n=1 Tax=Cryobacterium melibiosiphilum TaxID=995039 RepID=A0A3A5MCM7_9MICO|nr:ATP-binding cassette domain-containing protein [Cryobacterium melibiosiphilum]RJT87877.1 ATP-binding cassette domain-containing protein [Cryobacterium melibiosiphilum]